jgi:NitT/TauT family transport system permease protein
VSRGGRGPHWADGLPGRAALGAVIPALILLAWWLGIRSGTAVVPGFGEVWHVLTHPFETPPDIYSRSLGFSLMMTLIRLALGFGLGVVTAVPLGLLAGQNRAVDRLLQPAVQMARPINPIVLLPIATVLFGISSLASLAVGHEEAWRHDVWDQVQVAMVLILWWGAFFPVFLSTVHGVRSARTSYVEALRLMGATASQTFRHVYLPHALPSAANGMRIAMGVTWLVLIAAEIFPGTRSGLGYMLCVACKTSDYQYTFAAIIVIGVVAYLTDLGLARLERAAGHWQAPER